MTSRETRFTEADLPGLGIHRIPIPVPFAAAGGPVNAYLVEDADGLLLFDAGLGTPEAEAALEAGFERAGRRLDEVRRIVLSHGHVDHYGGARSVVERAGGAVPVHAHALDVPKVAESGWRWDERTPYYVAHLLALGVPADAAEAVALGVGASFRLARRLGSVRPIAPGEILPTKHLALEVHHMPGHTPGLVCLYDRRHRLFFSSDHLLEKVSPNPIMELGPHGEERFRPLVAYLESLQRLEALEVDLILPGHGAPFGEHRGVIRGLLEFHHRRQDRIREQLASGEATCFELTRALFPAAGRGELFLAVSEAIAHLQVLEAAGEVSRAFRGGAHRFSLAA